MSGKRRAARNALIGALLLSAAAAVANCSGSEEPPLQPPDVKPRTATLQAAGRALTVELAVDDVSRARGLKHRTHLDSDAGMLFIFPEARPQRFWMQDTLIPLDLAFLDSDGTIQNIEHGQPGVEQPGYMSLRAARFVLELNAGWCESHGLRAGDKVAIPPELLALAR